MKRWPNGTKVEVIGQYDEDAANVIGYRVFKARLEPGATEHDEVGSADGTDITWRDCERVDIGARRYERSHCDAVAANLLDEIREDRRRGHDVNRRAGSCRRRRG